ncbi:hypothetical protein SGRI78S_03953 [Streptomyces griseus subsp. griseus]
MSPRWFCTGGRGRSAGSSTTGSQPSRLCLPVLPQPLAARRFQEVPLPVGEREVSGLGRLGQRRAPPELLGVEAAELVGEQRHRPHVGGDVVQGEGEDVAVGAAQQERAHHAALVEGERRSLAGAFQAGGEGRGVEGAGVLHREVGVEPGQHALVGLAVRPAEGGAQHGVAVHEPLERAPQGFGVDLRQQPYGQGDVQRGRTGVLLLQEDHGLLVRGQRQAVAGGGGGLPRGRRGGGVEGQSVDRRAREQLLQRQLHAGRPGDGGLEFDGGERVESLADQWRGPVHGDAEAAGGGVGDDGAHGVVRRAPPREGGRPGCRRGGERAVAGVGPVHHLHRGVGEGRPGRGPLDLAAGGAGDLAGPDEHHGAGRHGVLPHERGADGADDRVGRLRHVAVRRLQDEADLLAAVPLDGEGGGAPAQRVVRGEGRGLQVLRVVVAAPDHDQVLAAAGDVQAAVAHEAVVAGAQVGAGVAGQPGAEGAVRRGVSPVPVRHVLPGDPDLADGALGAGLAALGVGDGEVQVHGDGPAVDHGQPVGRGLGETAGAEGVGAEGPGDVLTGDAPAGHHQGRLGEAVAGEEGVTAEAEGRHAGGEPVEGARPDRLSAVERHLPPRQVESGEPLLGDAVHAQVVREVRTTADRGAQLGYQFEPQERAGDEGGRAEQGGRRSRVDGLEDAADQAHVVVRRQPAHHGGVRSRREPLLDLRRVGHQVAVGDPDAARGTRGTGGVLEERQAVPVDVRTPPVPGAGQFAVHGQQLESGGVEFLGEFGGARRLRAGDERGGGPRVGEDGQVPGGVLAAARRVQRDGDGARVQAAEERHHVVEARREQDQDPLAGESASGEHGADRPGPGVEFREGQRGPLVPPGAHEGVGGATAERGAFGHDVHEGRGGGDREVRGRGRLVQQVHGRKVPHAVVRSRGPARDAARGGTRRVWPGGSARAVRSGGALRRCAQAVRQRSQRLAPARPTAVIAVSTPMLSRKAEPKSPTSARRRDSAA